MEILFVSEQVVRFGDANLPSALETFIKRYSKLGSLTCMCYKTGNGFLKLPKEFENCKFVFLKKENSLSTLIQHRSYNLETIRNSINKYNLVIIHFPSAIGNHAVRIAHKAGIPVVGGVVGCAFEALWFYDWRGKILALPSFYKMKRSIAMCDHAFYVSENYLQKRYPCSGMKIGCSNVELPTINEIILSERIERIKVTDLRNLELATIGNLDLRYKGHKYVLLALAKLKKMGYHLNYHLIGGGDPTRLQNLAKKLNIEDCIFYHGVMSHDELMECLINCDLYIQPSLTEGIPRSIIEAMSVGLPVLGTNIPGILELISQPYTFLPKKSKGIVNLVKNLTIDKLLEMSIENSNNSLRYNSSTLNERRTKFFNIVLKNY